jgi:hypothetical protein
VYLAAFWTLAPQVGGLIGPHGILPAGTFAGAVMTDARLVGICAAGALLAVLLIAGIASAIVLPLLWALYWSLSRMSADFLAFQWDALLLEAGLLAIFVAPLTFVDRPGRHEPRAAARWLIWWLLFRLMLASGIVKLASGDPVWRDLTALHFHYETQPLPTPLAWYIHQLPMSVHRASAFVTFVIELGLPWLIFTPRRLRAFASAGFVLLQTLIALTGNYAFFNGLCIALALTLLDDEQVMFLIRKPIVVVRGEARRWPRAPIYAAAFVTVPVSLAILVSQAHMRLPGTSLILPLYELTAPLRSVNGYGLFAVMTTTRPEIVVEGSRDGVIWKPYTFRATTITALKGLCST